MLQQVAKVAYTRLIWQIFVVVVGGMAKWRIFLDVENAVGL